MRNYKKLIIVFVGLIFLSINLYSSSYSVISESSPWGIVPIWESNYNTYPERLDSLDSLGISWTRPNCIPSGRWLTGYFNDTIFVDKLEEIDSFVKYNNERGLSYMYVGGQGQHDNVEWDTTDIYLIWRVLAERYDGENDGGYYYNNGQYIEEAWLNDSTPLIIEYWEICNEPQFHPEWWSGVEGEYTIEAFQKYVKYASIGIHAGNSNAKVIGPVIEPLTIRWDNTDTIEYMSPDSFWKRLGENTLNYFDILSFHSADRDAYGVYLDDHNLDFIYIDSMLGIWDSLGYNQSGKPIWLTEGGWSREDFSDDSIAKKYKAYAESLLVNRDIVQRKFFFCLWLNCEQFNILHSSDGSHYPAADTLKAFIHRNTPKIELMYPDSFNEILYSGNQYIIYFDNVYDSFDSNGTAYSTNLSSIKVRLELSTDGGISWEIIADSLSVGNTDNGNGHYSWEVPYVISDFCKVRAIARDPHRLEGTSTGDGYFSIRPSYWSLWEEPHPFEWNASYQIGTFDECDDIIETADSNYLLAVKINQDSTGLVVFNPDSQVFSHVKTFSQQEFTWIHNMLEIENNNQANSNHYIIVGKNNILGNNSGTIRIFNSNYQQIIYSNQGTGEIRKVIEDISGDGYIAVGWKDNNSNKCWMRRFTIEGNLSGGIGVYPRIVWDRTFADSFNNLQISGKLYSLIKTSDSNYLAVGYRPSSNGGASFFKFNQDGEIIDSGIYTYQPNKWSLFYDVAEANNGYVMVGTTQDYSGATIVKIDLQCDTTIWEEIYDSSYFSDSLNICRLYSVFINQNNTIITGGYGIDPITNRRTGLILQIDTDNGDILNITAPLSGLYHNTWNMSLVRPIYPTQDTGYVIAGFICDNTVSPWLKKIAICKFSYDGVMNPASQSVGGFPFGINVYSVVCASSVFRNQSTIRYMVPRNTYVNVCVYNILGQKVTTLVNGFKDAGVYEVIWNGTDNRGTNVSSGSYFLRFQTEDYIDTKTMTVIR